ncbi:branched-chain amino acid ABC transporter permease [Cupriavidus pampae]|uniref:High-affinity branched-chain amino acid transport system permease protein LivH n=1 Tax=Cupriavidus pampae TaxID=659251 RepID=A0ABN7Z6Z3_9BURK|nr:branched-chain amino acid ABC transporter permease [Cupriavidus pampae]CAG9180082.1 High-affinity branched-chain amino acid transport system permease protein LivH [Cupriavidus pampae]
MEVSFNLIAQQLVTGLALGSIYVLIGVGLSLVFGLLTVVNFAHGAFFMVGAYIGVLVYARTGNFWLCMLVVPIASAALGMLAERFLIRPLYGRGIDYPLLLTFGLAYVLMDLVRMGFGVQGEQMETPELLQGAVDIGIGMFPLYRLFLIGVTAFVLLALWLLLEKTRFGLIVRAGARDPLVLRTLGINMSTIWLTIFGAGTAIAGLAGLLAAPMRGVSPEMGVPVLVEAFVITVVGGMGSLGGAVVAGLLVGVVVSFTTLFQPEFADFSMFALMAIMLIVRPNGLFGRKGLMA